MTTTETTVDVNLIRETSRATQLGYLDAVLERREIITALSTEELNKLATLVRPAGNGCCNGVQS